ncbi:MAG: hypothetical protein ABWY31_05320 [Pseudoxanthomonas sp.]
MIKIGILFVFLLIAFAVCACGRRLTATSLEAIASEGRGLDDERFQFGSIASDRWPPAIAALRPERVYRTPDGLYIATDSFFVEERGLFVPDSKAAVLPGRESDPSYEVLCEGVFAYEIKG